MNKAHLLFTMCTCLLIFIASQEGTAETSDTQERSTKSTDEQLVVTLEALSARGLLEDSGIYFDALERESEKPFFQIMYRAQNNYGAPIILSKTVVTVNQDMAFITGFKLAHTPLFLHGVRKEWGVSTKKTKVIKDSLVKGTIYSLYKKEKPWGFLFEGHAEPYIFYVVTANLGRLDLALFERIVREHIQTVAELPRYVEPSDIALDSYLINFPSATISVLIPGPPEKQPYALSPQEKSFLRNKEAYNYFGRLPLGITVNWSRLQEGEGPANLVGGVRGGMSALAQVDGVTDLEYKTMETTVSGLHGLRVSGSFNGHDGKMKYEAVFWVKDDDGWNVSIYLRSRDKKAHQAAIRIVESVAVTLN